MLGPQSLLSDLSFPLGAGWEAWARAPQARRLSPRPGRALKGTCANQTSTPARLQGGPRGPLAGTRVPPRSLGFRSGSPEALAYLPGLFPFADARTRGETHATSTFGVAKVCCGGRAGGEVRAASGRGRSGKVTPARFPVISTASGRARAPRPRPTQWGHPEWQELGQLWEARRGKDRPGRSGHGDHRGAHGRREP